jgi:hypothetical protein
LGRKGTLSLAKDPKTIKKKAHIEKETALKPIVIGELSEDIKFNKNYLPELPTY